MWMVIIHLFDFDRYSWFWWIPLTWFRTWLFWPSVLLKICTAFVTLVSSLSANHTGGVDGYVSFHSESRRRENGTKQKELNDDATAILFATNNIIIPMNCSNCNHNVSHEKYVVVLLNGKENENITNHARVHNTHAHSHGQTHAFMHRHRHRRRPYEISEIF